MRTIIPIVLIFAALQTFNAITDLGSQILRRNFSPPSLDFTRAIREVENAENPYLIVTNSSDAHHFVDRAMRTLKFAPPFENFRLPYGALVNATDKHDYYSAANFAHMPPFDKTASGAKSYTFWYNDSQKHALPMTTNVLNSALYRAVAGGDETIRVSSHPYVIGPHYANKSHHHHHHAFPDPQAMARRIDLLLYEMALFVFASITAGAMAVAGGVLAGEICFDRQAGADAQLRLGGASSTLYWSSFGLYHALVWFAPSMIFLVVIASS